MQTLQFPLTLTHRDNPHAQVVVANAEQLAQMPEEYLPVIIGGAPAVLTAAAAIPGVNLDAGTSTAVDTADLADLAERRQSLDEAVDEFTAHVQAETAKIDAERAELLNFRSTLNQQADQQEQANIRLTEREDALARERAQFEEQRASASEATGESQAPAAPAKRSRTTKEGS